MAGSRPLVGIVGTGLIGTSIGMALRRRPLPTPVLFDADSARAATASALGAGRTGTEIDLQACDHIVVAVPPAVTARALHWAQGLNVSATFSDVASVKASVLADAENMNCDMTRFCGGHPIAGRERGGPTAATPELFDDAIWVSTPATQTSPRAIADVRWLAEQCGARSVEMPADEHDRALALVSHLPQLVASLLAAQLPAGGPAGPLLAGRGFRDTTRLADSDPALWVQIALANRDALAVALDGHARRAGSLLDALKAGDGRQIEALLQQGAEARGALPTKTSPMPVKWARLGVVLRDQPGELARLFAVAGKADVNIEDVTIDHATDHPVGLVILDVAPASVARLTDAVRDAGWHVLTIA